MFLGVFLARQDLDQLGALREEGLKAGQVDALGHRRPSAPPGEQRGGDPLLGRNSGRAARGRVQATAQTEVRAGLGSGLHVATLDPQRRRAQETLALRRILGLNCHEADLRVDAEPPEQRVQVGKGGSWLGQPAK